MQEPKHLLYFATIHYEDDHPYTAGALPSAIGVSFHDFPGCITAVAYLQDLVPSAQEAISLHIEGLIKDGQPIPLPSSFEDVRDGWTCKDQPRHLMTIPIPFDSNWKTVRLPSLGREMTGAQRIQDERNRQVEQEGFTAKHDDQHKRNELGRAAAAYAWRASSAAHAVCIDDRRAGELHLYDLFPAEWASTWDKRAARNARALPMDEERIVMLTKAGALIAAEIDRLLRSGPRS